jgi:NDP-hexose-3-ketoreductase
MILNVGIIACSSVAKRRFLPAIKRVPTLKLWRVGSRSNTKAKLYADLFNFNYAGSYEEVILDPLVDLVYISTPPNLHYEITLDALTNGKHVICEKPVAQSLSQLRKLKQVAESRKLIFAEHYSFLNHPQNMFVKCLVDQGTLGTIRRVCGVFHYPMPPELDIRLEAELFGGILNDSIGYPILAAVAIIDAELKFLRATVTLDSTLGIDRSCYVEYTANNIKVTGDVSLGMEYQAYYEVEGDIGSIKVNRPYSVDIAHKPEVSYRFNETSGFYDLDKGDQIVNFLYSFIENLELNANTGVYCNNFYSRSDRLRLALDAILDNSSIRRDV